MRFSTRLTDPVNHLQVEIIEHDNEHYAYINVHSFSIPCYNEDPKKAQLILITPEKELNFIVSRLEGGQRLRIPPEIVPEFLSILSEHDTLTLTLGHHYLTLMQPMLQ